jgi:protein subunit release factor B
MLSIRSVVPSLLHNLPSYGSLPPLMTRHKSYKDKSSLPRLDPADLQEKVNPGMVQAAGQAVNKTANAVFLKHLPTGLWVKCHQTRSVEINRKIAKQLLVAKLDNLVNGENSIENQKKVIDKIMFERKKEKTRIKYEERKLQSLMKNSEDQSEEPA